MTYKYFITYYDSSPNYLFLKVWWAILKNLTDLIRPPGHSLSMPGLVGMDWE